MIAGTRTRNTSAPLPYRYDWPEGFDCTQIIYLTGFINNLMRPAGTSRE